MKKPYEVRIQCFDRSSSENFRVIGTGRWAKPGDSWLAAHDILHHGMGPVGSVEDELMTFGVELWLEMHQSGVHAIDYSMLSGVICDNKLSEVSCLRRHILGAGAPVVRVPSAVREKFKAMAEDGLSDAAESIDRKSGRKVAEELLVRFAGNLNRHRYVQWMCYGFRLAQSRYPNPVIGRGLFHKLEEALSKSSSGKHVLQFQINERKGELKPLNAKAEKALSL